MKSLRTPSALDSAGAGVGDVEPVQAKSVAPGKRAAAPASPVVQRKPAQTTAGAPGSAGPSARSQADWMHMPDMMAAHGFVSAAPVVQRKAAAAADDSAQAVTTNAAASSAPDEAKVHEARAASADHVRLLQRIERVDGMLQAAQSEQPGGGMLGTWAQLRARLRAHFQFEDSVLFPQILAGQQTGSGDIARMQSEHQDIFGLVSALRSQSESAGAAASELLGLLDEIDTHARMEDQTLAA